MLPIHFYTEFSALSNNIELTSQKILSYRFVTRHIAMLEEQNRAESKDNVASIDKFWNYMLSYSKNESVSRTLLQNVIEVYKHLLNDNFSSLNFRGLDLSGINFGIFNFTPEDTSLFDEHAFDGAVFDAKTFPLGGHIGAVYSVDAYGSKLVSYSANAIIVWDIFKRQGVDSLYLPETVLFEKGAEPAVCFCPTANETIAFNYGGGIIEMKLPLHDVGATDRMFDFENDNVVSLCYSPNGKYLSASCASGMTCIWDVESKNRIYYGLGVPKLHISNAFLLRQVINGVEVVDFTKGNMTQFAPFLKGESVRCAVFTRNGTRVFFLTISEESVKLYSWCFSEENPSLLREFNEFILDLSVSDDGQQLSLCRLDLNDCVIDTTDGKTLGKASMRGLPWCCSYITNPPKGYGNIFFSGTNTGKIWGLYAQNSILYALSLYDGHRPCVNNISLRNDERYILAAYDDGMIREWKIRDEENNLATPLLSHVYSEHKGSVSCVVYSDNGEYFVSCSTDDSIIVWDTYAKVNIFEIENAHEHSVKGVLFTDEGKLISYGSKGEIKLWNIETRELLLSFPILHNDLITDMFYCFGEDYDRAVSCSLDGQIIIWKIVGTTVTQEHLIDCPKVSSLSFCEQTQTFFSNSRDNSIRKWSLDSSKPIGSEIILTSEGFGSRNAQTIASSKDGNRILFADDGEEYNLDGRNNHILEIVFDTNECETKILTHTGNVTNVVYLSDECYAVSASLDGNIAILDLRERKVIHTARIVTDFETKLGAYNLENVVYRPKWIKKFYAGVKPETPKINAPEHLEKLAASLRNGVVLNIFDFIKEEKDIAPLVDLFFSCTMGLSDPADKKAMECEKAFFLANVYYLWYEAPVDEQNMFMLAELFIAALDDDNREDNKDYNSDLDRLFNMLSEKKPSHTSLELYSKYKMQPGKKFIIQSCYKRLYPVCGAAEYRNEQKSFFYFVEEDCEKFIDSVTANFDERNATEGERILLKPVLSRALSNVNDEVSLYKALGKMEFSSDNERTVFEELFGGCMDFFREFK